MDQCTRFGFGKRSHWRLVVALIFVIFAAACGGMLDGSEGRQVGALSLAADLGGIDPDALDIDRVIATLTKGEALRELELSQNEGVVSGTFGPAPDSWTLIA